MNFGDALADLKKGAGYTREVWRDTSRYVTLEGTEMVLIRPFAGFGVGPKSAPWKPGPGDVIAEDWLKVKDAPTPEPEQGNGPSI